MFPNQQIFYYSNKFNEQIFTIKMLTLIRNLPILIKRTKFIVLIPSRNFKTSQHHFKSHPFRKQSIEVSWKLPSNDEKLQPKNVYDFFKSIQKIDCVTVEDVRKEKFQKFLDNVQSSVIHQMTGREISQVLIGIIRNNSLIDHELNGCVVNALISKIQDIPFFQLASLDYLIQKFKLNDLYKDLRSRIQIIFLFETDELLDNCKNFKKIKPVFEYMRKNVDIVSLEALNKLAVCLMRFDNTYNDYYYFSIDNTTNIIFLYSQFNHLSKKSIQTLNRMVELWCKGNPQFRDVELLLSLLATSEKINKRALEDADFIRFVFKFLEDKCDEKANGCFDSLIKLGYWRQSVDLMSQLFERGLLHSNVQFFITLCSCCKKYKYTPTNWKSSIVPALEKFDFRKHIEQQPDFNWPAFALKLNTLGHTDIDLIDALVKSPKYFNSPFAEKLEDILNESRTNGANVDPKIVIKFFNGLSKVKNISAKAVQRPEFQSFLSQTMQIIHQMSGSEILPIMIEIIHHEQLRNNPINECVLNALISKSRELEFKDMAFLDFLIHRMKLNSIYEKLRTKIQRAFIENVDRILDECDDFENLLTTMQYMRDNANIISAKDLSRLSHFLMMADGHFNISDITRVLSLFSQFNYLEEQVIECLNKMVQMWCKCNPEFRDVELLLSLFKFNEKRDEMDKLAFENSGLIRFIFDFLNGSNEPQTCACLGNLIRMGYWEEGIESIAKLFEKRIINSNDVNAYITLCISCDKYKFKPLNWQSTILPMLKSFDFRPHIERHKKLDWPLFARSLHSLGYNDYRLIEALLTSEKFNNSRHSKKLNYILMQESPDEVYSVNDCFDTISHLQRMSALISEKSLQRSLKGIIGEENILCDYEVSENFKVPFIAKVDFHEEKFIPINKSKMTENLKATEKLIGIFIVDNEDKWLQLKELLETIDIGEMDLEFMKIIPDKWLSKQMIVMLNDDRRDILLQEIVKMLRSKVRKNYF